MSSPVSFEVYRNIRLGIAGMALCVEQAQMATSVRDGTAIPRESLALGRRLWKVPYS